VHPTSRLILGIESSCDETAAAVVDRGGIVRSSVVASQDAIHAEYGGVVPELASRAHAERILPVIRSAVHDAGTSLDRIDAVAVGHRPGLIGALLVGVSAAKALAWSLGKPLIGVDHVHAHLFAPLLIDAATEPAVAPAPQAVTFPALGLVVSGGHTSLYRLDSWTTLSRMGATIDDALGEAFDKAAAILGIPFPGGSNLDRLASSPGANDRAHRFPLSRLGPHSLDFSFSGLKTSLLYAVRGVPGPGGVFERDHASLSDLARADLAASFQHAAVAAAVLKVERALDAIAASDGPACRTLMVGGGVSANSRLRRELTALGVRRGVAVLLPAPRYCVDNAAMIAGLAHELADADDFAGLDLQAVPTTSC